MVEYVWANDGDISLLRIERQERSNRIKMMGNGNQTAMRKREVISKWEGVNSTEFHQALGSWSPAEQSGAPASIPRVIAADLGTGCQGDFQEPRSLLAQQHQVSGPD